MTFSLKSILALGVGVIATVAMSPSAFAYTLGAWAGKAHYSSNASLFSEDWGGVSETGGSGSYASWDLPIPLTQNGNLDVDVFANVESSGGFTNCSLQYGNSYGGGAGTSWSRLPIAENGWDDTTYSIYTSNDSNAELRCEIFNGDQIEGITY